MFTGIVQGMAQVLSVTEKERFRIHEVRMPAALLPGLVPGASVAHNGCCLTVTAINGERVSFDLMQETLRLTNLGELQPGDRVNVERAAKFGDEIGGHLMSGHIITTALISDIIETKNNREVWLKPQETAAINYIFHKGFIGVDGISLTVGEVTQTHFCVHLIPETLMRTTLGGKKVGQRVNLEVDPQTQAIVTTVERLMAQREKKERAL